MPRRLDDLELKPNERAALEELRSALRERFGDRLVKLVLLRLRRSNRRYTPMNADGQAPQPCAYPRSSVSICGCLPPVTGGDPLGLIGAVVRDFDRSAEADAVSALRAEIDFRHGVFLQLLAYSEGEYNERLEHQWPLFVDMESEGVALHGSVSGCREPGYELTPANRRYQAGMLMERARRSLRSAESMFSVPDLHTAASSEACAAVLRAAEAILVITSRAKGAAKRNHAAPGSGPFSHVTAAHITAADVTAPYVAGTNIPGADIAAADIPGAFEARVVKAGEMHARFAKLLHEARQRRVACTSDVTHEETKERAASMLGNARAFLAAAEKRLKAEIGRLK